MTTEKERQEASAKKVIQQLRGGLQGVTALKMIEYPAGVFSYAICFPCDLWELNESRGVLLRKIETPKQPEDGTA